ncbi:MAG TPA: hypothetical protein VGL82_11345 [Bryobacteraceae bacterium]
MPGDFHGNAPGHTGPFEISNGRSSLGASYRLLQTIEQRLWRPVISPALALEYESVLKRGVGELGVSLVDIDDFIAPLQPRTAGPDLFPLEAYVAGPRR